MKGSFLLVFILAAAAASPQLRTSSRSLSGATNGKRRPHPPPPPGARRKKASEKWVWDDNCPNDRPPFGVGRWIKVSEEDCPIAFNDPDFEYHMDFCVSFNT